VEKVDREEEDVVDEHPAASAPRQVVDPEVVEWMLLVVPACVEEVPPDLAKT